MTHSFKETVTARIERDTEFRDALLREGVECLLSGDVDTGIIVARLAYSPYIALIMA